MPCFPVLACNFATNEGEAIILTFTFIWQIIDLSTQTSAVECRDP